MNYFKKTIIPILLTGIWINLFETLRWEFLVKSYWLKHYEQLEIIFPSGMINNSVWMVWGFMLATTIFLISKKFTLIQTTLLAWFAVFVMLWAVLWNIGMLPHGMLWIVAPLSLFEAFTGALICKKLASN